MATWTYSDWTNLGSYPTPALQRARLGLHIQEVANAIQADVSRDGASRSSQSLTTYLDGLRAEDKRLRMEAGSTGSVARVRL